MNKNNLILLGVVMLVLMACKQSKIESFEVLKWKGGATAAYTIIHDDLCSNDCSGIHRYADTIAYNRGIKIGAGAIVGSCVQKGEPMWRIMRRMVSHGHEILSHSWSHGAAVDLGWVGEDWYVERDVVMTKKMIEENVPGAEINFMIFPYDAYNDQRIIDLKKNGYLGSRSGPQQYSDRGVITDFSTYDPFRSNLFDAFVSREEQERLSPDGSSSVSIYNNTLDDIEIQHIDAAISTQGWSIQELHSVDDEQPWGWGRMPVDRYRALIDYAKEKADKGQLWVETPTAVIRYIMTREYIPAPRLVNGELLDFSIPDNFDLRYATELSFEINLDGKPSELIGLQAGKIIQAEKFGNNRFVMNINPAMGNVKLSIQTP